MGNSRKTHDAHDGRGRRGDWFKDSPEGRIKRTYSKVGGLKVDPCDEYLLAEYNFRIHKHKGYVETLNSLKLSRLIMAPNADEVVDHINGDKLDNRRTNLRVCTQSENARNNNKPRKRKTSHLFKGVHWDGSAWVAQIQVNKIKHYLGRFSSEFEAARAYDRKAKELHGAFASLNFPSGHDSLIACID